MRPVHRAALVLIAGAIVAILVGETPVASAHSGDQSYVYLDIFDDTIEGRVEYPVSDLNDVLDLDIPQEAEDAIASAEASRTSIEAYTARHLALGPAEGGGSWSYSFDELEVLEAFPQTYVIVHFQLDDELDVAPRRFHVAYDGVIESKPERDAFLLIGTDWMTGQFANENEELLRYTAGNTDQIVDLDDASWWRGFRATVGLGTEHIRTGTDHILFVAALVLPAVLVFTTRPGDRSASWRPTRGFGSSLWRVLKIVTMFTVAHSITFALGGLGIVEFRPRLVETVIALSIVLAALHNLRPVFPNREWVLAFGFGLFHGFGFAGLLSDLGLDRDNRLETLLGFNLGVEIGQAIIILMLFPTLYIMRRTRYYRPLMFAGSIVLAGVALAWALERMFEIDTPVDRLIDPLVIWPRALWLMPIGLAVAAATWAIEKRAGRLIPLDDPGSDVVDPQSDLVSVD